MEKINIENKSSEQLKQKEHLFFSKMDKIIESIKNSTHETGAYEKIMQEMELNKILFRKDLNMDVDLEYVYPFFEKDTLPDQGIGNHFFSGKVGGIKTDKGLVREGSDLREAHLSIIENPDNNEIIIKGAPDSYPENFDFENTSSPLEKEISVKGKDAQLAGKMISKMITMTNFTLKGAEKENGFKNEINYKISYEKGMENKL